MNIKILSIISLILATSLTAFGKDLTDMSNWHDGDTVAITTDSRLANGSTLPCVRLTIAARVGFADEGCHFADGSIVEVRSGGVLDIDHDVTFGKNCRIYAEDGAIVIADGMSLNIGQGSTLYLQRNSVQGNGSLIGDCAEVAAPTVQIFGESVSVEGRWLNKRILPQWFGAIAYPNLSAATEGQAFCSAEAIEKAARMAQGAEVFIPSGYYKISRPIRLSSGINICGTTGHETRGTSLVSTFDYEDLRKSLKNTNKLGESYQSGNYLIEINIKKSDSVDYNPQKIQCEKEYCTRESYIKNLRLVNNSFPQDRTDNGAEIYLMYGILSGASLTIDGVSFQHFGQALRFTDDYIDNKCVTNCTMCEFWNPEKLHQDESHKAYAFNMGFLGDALTFAHNGISGDANKGLLINFCGGANISNNIITAECLIKNSKGIEFSSNHFEIGTPLKIENSVVTMRSNYFWLASQPVVQIYGSEGSIVTMDGDVFRFYDSAYYIHQTNYAYKPHYCIQADIAIDRNSRLNLSNVYRYWEGKDFNTVKPSGVIVCEHTADNGFGPTLNEFKRFSYALSRNCQISSRLKVNMQFEESDLTKPFSPRAYGMLNDNVAWVSDVVGKFSYQYQLILDSERRIGWTDEGTGLQKLTIWNGNGFVDTVTVGQRFNAGDSRMVTKGILIVAPQKYGIIRIVRTAGTNGAKQYVDVPLCGTQHLYDNGISICGYAWKAYNPSDEIILNEGVEGAEFNGAKAKFYVKRTDLHHLQPTDVVYNVSNKFILDK